MHRTLFVAVIAIACAPSSKKIVIEGYEFPGGDFTFETTAVTDQCANGAFDALFVSSESGEDPEWPQPVAIPSWSEMEAGAPIEVQLHGTPQPMTMTITQGATEGSALLSDGAQGGIVLNEAAHGDCTTGITMDGTLEVLSNDEVSGSATVGVENLQGERCPQVTEGCVILLDFYGMNADEN